MRKKYTILIPLTICLSSCNTKVTFELINLGNNLDIHNSYITEFLTNPVDSHVHSIADGTNELSKPKPVPLSWTTKGANAKKYTIKVSENSDMSNPLIYTTNEKHYDLYNCKINTKYYWTVEANNCISEVATFSSKDLKVRTIDIDGVTNCRDLGGYVTSEGKEIKQGLIYRTGRYNKSKTYTITNQITDKGIYTFKNELKIKTEVDLRRDQYEAGGLTDTSVIPGVNYKSYKMEWEDLDNLLLDNKEIVKDLFEDVLSKEESYPLSFHCNIGTDRTGCIAYTLLALCGVPKEDLVGDYLLSNYAKIGAPRRFADITNTYPKTIDDAEGSALKDKAENVLLNTIGVSQQAINNIRSILIK